MRSTRYSGLNSRLVVNSLDGDLAWRPRTGDFWVTGLDAGSASGTGMNSRCCTAGETGGLRKRIGIAVEEDSLRSLNDEVGLACSGDLVGELGPETGSGGSSSGNASSCHGCRPVRRVSSARLSSMDKCGGVLGRSIPPDGARNVWVPASARLPGMILSACCAWASISVSSSGGGVASATALSTKKDCSSSYRRC